VPPPASSNESTITIRIGFVLLIALLIVAAASKAILYDTLDPDCFWHLRVAEQLDRHGVRPLVDELSFMSLKQPWTPYSWLAELGMKRLWDLGGWRAAVAAQAAIVVWCFIMIALAGVEMTRPPRPFLGIALSLVFAGYIALPYLSFRPATMACALLATCMWLIARDRRLEHRSWTVWLIVPITALLINIHLFAIFVPIWMAIFALEQRTWRALALLLLTAGASCATPMLRGVVQSMAHYGNGDPMVGAGVIAELVPFYKGSMWWITGGVLLVAIGLMAWRSDTSGAGEWMCLGLGLIGMLRMGRLAPIFTIVAAPMLASALTMLRGRALRRPVVGGVLGLALIFAGWQVTARFPSRQAMLSRWLNRHGPDAPGYPCGAVEFVRNTVRPSTGRVINSFTWGGYIAFELGPQFQVFMDPRTQLYAPEFWRATCLGDERSCRALLRSVKADAAILPLDDDDKLVAALRSLGWKQVYRDDRAQVLLPPQ
jgi:hypothetical protein